MTVSFDAAELERLAGVGGRGRSRSAGSTGPIGPARGEQRRGGRPASEQRLQRGAIAREEVEAREDESLLRGRQDARLVRAVERDDVGAARATAAAFDDESELHPPTRPRRRADREHARAAEHLAPRRSRRSRQPATTSGGTFARESASGLDLRGERLGLRLSSASV